MKKIYLGIFTILLLAVGCTTSQTNQQKQIVPPGEQGMVGASIPVAVARFETSLQSKISAAATSLTLTSDPLYTKIGTSLTGYVCLTIDEGTAVVEDICGTASGTAISSLTRGMSPLTGTSSVSSLAFEHRKGATVKITDAPQLLVVSRILNGNETLPNPIRYDSTISTTTLASNSNYLASVGFVTGTALQGAPTATTTLPGVVQVATTAQIAAGTGMTGAYTLVPAGSLFSQAWRNATTIPVTNATGTLDTRFIDQTASYTWSGTHSFNGTVNLNGTTNFVGGTNGVSISQTFTAGAGIGAGQAVFLDNAMKFDSSNLTIAVGGPGANPSGSFTVGNNANRFLVAVVMATTAPTSITYAGATMTQTDTITASNGWLLYVYTLPAPAVGSNTFQINVVSTYVLGGLYSYYGAAQTGNPEVTSKNSSQAGTTVSNSITTITPGAIVLTAAFEHSSAVGGYIALTGMSSNSATTTLAVSTNRMTLAVGDSGVQTTAGSKTSTATFSTGDFGYMFQISIKPVANDSSGYVIMPSVGTATSSANFIGFSTSSIATGSTGSILLNGVITGLSGIVPGYQYYIANATGTVSTTPGSILHKAGIGITPTSLLITNIW